MIGTLHDLTCAGPSDCTCIAIRIAKPCVCGHSDRMHVTGASPRYAGCMVVIEGVTGARRRRYCSCSRTPAEAAGLA